MKGKFCERFDALYNELGKIYPGYDIIGARYLNEDGVFPYYFNIKEHKSQLLPLTIVVYEPDLVKAFIATSSDGILEKKIIEFFDKNEIKSELQKGIRRDSIEILKIPFEGIKEMCKL